MVRKATMRYSARGLIKMRERGDYVPARKDAPVIEPDAAFWEKALFASPLGQSRFFCSLRLLRANGEIDHDERSKEIMSRGWKSVFAVAAVWVMLCELAAGPAQAQYANPYPYPAAPYPAAPYPAAPYPEAPPVAVPPPAAAPPVVAAPPTVAAYPYLWGGRRFCWYDRAWNGPGWYWCGYALRSGYGWGGGYGWNGWVWRGGGRGWRGGRGWHGDRGPGWRGDRYPR